MPKSLASATVSPVPAPISEDKDTDIFAENPRSVFNLLPPQMQDVVRKIPRHYFEKTEHELKLMLRPDPTTSRLRLAFWLEYDNAQAQNRKMKMPLVYNGACAKAYFSTVVMKDEEKLAWILCPPTDYMLAMRHILQEGIDQMYRIVTGQIVDSHGHINAKSAEILVKVMQLADLKLFGSAIVRTENKSLHVVTEVPAPKPVNLDDVSLDQIQAQIDAVRAASQPKNAHTPVIDVTPNEARNQKA